MPWLNNNAGSSGGSKSSMPGKDAFGPQVNIKPTDPRTKAPIHPMSFDEKIASGKSVTAYEIARQFKSLPARREIAKELGTSNYYSKDVDDVIDARLKGLKDLGTVIDPEEARSYNSINAQVAAGFAKRKREQEHARDFIITPEEAKASKKAGAGWSLLGKWFGWNK